MSKHMIQTKKPKKQVISRELALHPVSGAKYTSWNSINPLDPRIITDLHYCEDVAVTTSAGPGFVNYDWNLNSLFDPNSTGTGHQPRGYDQMTALYNRYRVYYVRWQVTATVTNSADGCLLAVMPSNNASPGTWNDVVEQTYGKFKSIDRQDGTTIYGGISMAQLNGKSPAQYAASDNTGSLVTGSPTEQLILHTAILNTAGAAVTYHINIRLVFDCEFSDPIQLNQS